MFSRMIHGIRISMTVGLVGCSSSLVVGGISGCYGTVDLLIRRMMEILRSTPTIPLWTGLAAAPPDFWSPVPVYCMITIIPPVRGRFFSLAKLDGCK